MVTAVDTPRTGAVGGVAGGAGNTPPNPVTGGDSLLRVVWDSLEAKLRNTELELDEKLEELEGRVLTEDDLVLVCKKITTYILEERLPSLLAEAARNAVREVMPEFLDQVERLLSSLPPPNVTVTVPKRQVRKIITYDQMSRPVEVIEVEEGS